MYKYTSTKVYTDAYLCINIQVQQCNIFEFSLRFSAQIQTTPSGI